jgi:hypothetical protein
MLPVLANIPNVAAQRINRDFIDGAEWAADTIIAPIAAYARDAGLDSSSFDWVGRLANTELPRTVGAGPFEAIVSKFTSSNTPPSPPLVGVETNPGPNARTRRARLRAAVSSAKTATPPARARVPRPPRRDAQQSVQNPPFVAAAYSTGNSVGKPVIIRNTDDSVTIRHRELLAVVTGTNNFTSTSYSLQPGLSSVFRWLSTQTNGWEKYRFIKLRAQYLTRTGSATPGTVMLVPDYDPADTAPTNETDASAFHGTTDDAPWKNQDVNFDMKRSKELFIRQGPTSANQDIKTYDFGNLYVCTADGTAVNWGKVYLEYEIQLINSQVLQSSNTGGAITPGGTGITTANLFGSAPIITPGSYVQSVTTAGTVTVSNLIVGQEYMVACVVTGTGLTAVNSTGFTGVTLRTNILNDLVNSGGTIITDQFTIIANANTATMTFTATGSSVIGTNFTFTSLSPTVNF